jgi:ribosome-associated translation inhibitor RaiA
MNAKVSITYHHFELSSHARQQIQKATEPLFEQDRHVTRVDITIEGKYSTNTEILYDVTLRAQLRAEVLFEMRQSEKILTAVESAVDTMKQKLRERSALPSA